jgi:hypothetical protein
MKYEVEVIKTVTQRFHTTVTVEAEDYDTAMEVGEAAAGHLSAEAWGEDRAEYEINSTYIEATEAEEVE